nr:MAG TPA: hypothetical protein [Bacteriophage sp.]
MVRRKSTATQVIEQQRICTAQHSKGRATGAAEWLSNDR